MILPGSERLVAEWLISRLKMELTCPAPAHPHSLVELTHRDNVNTCGVKCQLTVAVGVKAFIN